MAKLVTEITAIEVMDDLLARYKREEQMRDEAQARGAEPTAEGHQARMDRYSTAYTAVKRTVEVLVGGAK